jgi:hypothetical protein
MKKEHHALDFFGRRDDVLGNPKYSKKARTKEYWERRNRRC